MSSGFTLGRKSLAVLFAVAFAVAFALMLGTAQPAQAASTSGPYAGYKYKGSTAVTGAAYLQMTTSDSRKVKAGYENFYVYTGDSNIWDSVTRKNIPAKKAMKKLKGMSYNKKTNTLVLNNVNAPRYTLRASGMGTGFKIVLKGTSKLEGIDGRCAYMYNSKGDSQGYYPCSITITGAGTLELNKAQARGNAITLDGGTTKSALTIARTATVRMWAYGTGNVVSVTSAQPKNSSVISLGGYASETPLRATGKNAAYNSYKRISIVDWGTMSKSKKQLYTSGGKVYYVQSRKMIPETKYVDKTVVEEVVDPETGKPVIDPDTGKPKTEERVFTEEVTENIEYAYVIPVAKVGTTGYYLATSDVTQDVLSSSLTKSVSAYVISAYPSTSSAIMLKGGYYAVENPNAKYYYDTKERRSYASKWDIYKKKATAKVNNYSYTFAQKVKTVGNNKDLPKGYKAVIQNKGKASYNHVLKNGMLTVSS